MSIQTERLPMSADLAAECDELRLRIATARFWIDRHQDKWGDITIELACIRDGLDGKPSGVRDEVAAARGSAPECDHESQFFDNRWRCLRCGETLPPSSPEGSAQ